MGKYLDMLKRLDVKADDGEKSELREQRFTNPSSNEVSHNRSGDLIRLSRFFRPLDELERRRPEHVEPGRWHQAVEDGRRTAVHSAPDLPAPSSLRLHWLDLAFAGLSRRGAHAGDGGYQDADWLHHHISQNAAASDALHEKEDA